MERQQELLHFYTTRCLPTKWLNTYARIYFSPIILLLTIMIFIHPSMLSAIEDDSAEGTYIASAVPGNFLSPSISLEETSGSPRMRSFNPSELPCPVIVDSSKKQLRNALSECGISIEKQLFEHIFCNEDKTLRISYVSDYNRLKVDNWLIDLINKYCETNELIIRCENPMHRNTSQQQLIHTRHSVSEDLNELFDIDTLQSQENPTDCDLIQGGGSTQDTSDEVKSSLRYLEDKRKSFYAATLYLSYLQDTQEGTSKDSNQSLENLFTPPSEPSSNYSPWDTLSDNFYHNNDPFRLLFPNRNLNHMQAAAFRPPSVDPTPSYEGDVTFFINANGDALTIEDFDNVVYDTNENKGISFYAGSISAERAYIANTADGYLLQTNSELLLNSDLYIGYNEGVNGQYFINNGSTCLNNLTVGVYGSGLVTYSGGKLDIANGLILGMLPGSTGSFVLKNDAPASTYIDYYRYIDTITTSDIPFSVKSFYTLVGDSGYGSFMQWNGTAMITYWLGIGFNGTGVYTMGKRVTSSDGSAIIFNKKSMLLMTEVTRVGVEQGTGTFNQYQGTHATTTLQVGSDSGTGTYNLDGGSLQTLISEIGSSGGTAYFNHYRGQHTASAVTIGSGTNSKGQYILSSGDYKSGHLSTYWTTIGYQGGTGTMLHSGNATHETRNLHIGSGNSSRGTYTITDQAILKCGSMRIGIEGGIGELRIDSAETSITISKPWLEEELKKSYGSSNIPKVDSYLEFDENSIFTAVPGASIRLEGVRVCNHSTNSTNLSGLNNTHLIFAAGVNYFEAASGDYGATSIGFADGFSVDIFQIGADEFLEGGGDIVKVILSDTFDNTIDTELQLAATESIYVNQLIIGANTVLDLRNINIYYKSIENHGGKIQTFRGGELIEFDPYMAAAVPEPSAILFTLIGIIVFGRHLHSRRR